MNRINRKLEYSLVALRHMSQKVPGTLTTAKEVSETYQTPFDATARALQHMAQHGLMRSEHGASGGYVLVRDLSAVSLHDLMNIIEGPRPIAKCISGEEKCEIEGHCNIKSPIHLLDRKLTEFYRTLSIHELIGQEASRV